MKKLFPLFLLLVTAAIALASLDITFPVEELGGCASKAACKAYCDQKEHRLACLEFAKQHNLISEQEAQRASKAIELPAQGGPGGCQDFDVCRAYCSQDEHIDECIAFGKKHGLLEGEDVEHTSKLREVLKKGIKLPGNCTDKAACETYCHEEAHRDECLAFAHENGLMSEKEYELAKKTQGKGPGGCIGEKCEAYCRQEDHMEECIAFAKEHGLISEEEAQVAQKVRGKGPGGCQGEDCRAYCQLPEHHEECIAFAKEHGLIRQDVAEDQQERIYRDEPQREEKQERPVPPMPLDQDNTGPLQGEIPPVVVECIKQVLGPEAAERIKSGKLQPNADIQRNIRACFDRMQEMQEQEYEQKGGPGGCTSPEECARFCEDHGEECGQQRQEPPESPTLRKFGAILLDILFVLIK